jgi:hypothetical protein
VDGIASEVAVEVVVSFQQGDRDAGPGQQQTQNDPGRAAANDTTLRLECLLNRLRLSGAANRWCVIRHHIFEGPLLPASSTILEGLLQFLGLRF